MMSYEMSFLKWQNSDDHSSVIKIKSLPISLRAGTAVVNTLLTDDLCLMTVTGQQKGQLEHLTHTFPLRLPGASFR